MRKATFTLMLCLACICTGLYSETNIPLVDLYGVMPLDSKDDDPIIIDKGGNGIIATLDGRNLTVKVPATTNGNGKVIVTRTDTGIKVADRNIMGTEEHITLNTAGRYMLEVYTDTKAVGGVFEVK